MFRACGGAMAAGALLAGLMPAEAAGGAQRRDDVAALPRGDAVKAGADAWASGNYTRAIGIWRPLATAGDADAQYNLAQAYRLGRGVPQDEKVAQDWYRKAAAQDHPQAQANYGLLLFQGGDRKAALPWLRKAADRGDARAQYVVGTALFNGDVAPKDWVRAYALMTRAAASGLPPAVTSLAEMDKYIPLGQRTQGTALARELERSASLAVADGGDDLVRATPAARPAETAAATPPAKSVKPKPPVAPVVTADSSPPKRPAAKPAVAAPARPVQKPPVAVTLAPVTGGAWRVQVGAFGDAAAAGRAWDAIARKTPGLILRAYYVKAGAVTRLQAGPLATRAAASQACARIKSASGGDCFPVPAG